LPDCRRWRTLPGWLLPGSYEGSGDCRCQRQ